MNLQNDTASIILVDTFAAMIYDCLQVIGKWEERRNGLDGTGWFLHREVRARRGGVVQSVKSELSPDKTDGLRRDDTLHRKRRRVALERRFTGAAAPPHRERKQWWTGI